MFTTATLMLAVWFCCGLLAGSVAYGQGVRSYRPSRPTVSPYLNLLRTNTSGLPNYYSLVRPMEKQRQLNMHEQSMRRKQAVTLGRLEQGVQTNRAAIGGTGIGSRFMNQGTRSTHLNTGRYYPMPTNAGRSRARR